MDTVTHAVSGALVALALPKFPAVRWCLPLFCLVACLPDADILFSSTPSHFAFLHRGISHALVTLPLLALLSAVCCRPLWRKTTHNALPLSRLWLIFWLCLLIHVALDCVTSFGTRIFLPFSELRVRLNALFIVDLFLTVPLLVFAFWAGLSKRRRRRMACAGLCWLFFYPGLCLGLNALNSQMLEAKLANENRVVSNMTILPDFFSPFYWRAVYQETVPDGCTLTREQSLGGLGRLRGGVTTYTSLPEDLAMHLAAQSTECRNFLDLVLLPVVHPLPEQFISSARVALTFLPPDEVSPEAVQTLIKFERQTHGDHPAGGLDAFECGGIKYLMVSDLRFSSGLALGRQLLAMRPKANTPFRLLLVLDKDDCILLERAIFSDLRKDTDWKQSTPPEPQTFTQWLIGAH